MSNEVSAAEKLALMFKMPKWGNEEIEKAFLLWTVAAVEKAQWRFNIEEAIKLSSAVIDYEGMHFVNVLNKQNYIHPEEIFEHYARLAAKEFIKQIDFLNDCVATAIITEKHKDYKNDEFANYSFHPDRLLKFIKEEIDWSHVKMLDVSIDKKMEESNLGAYAQASREHLRNANIGRYRYLIEDDKLIDLLIKKEGAFLIAVESSVSNGMNRQEAINSNWNFLIDDLPSAGLDD